jgi:TP901 family phage tail tape measure protein
MATTVGNLLVRLQANTGAFGSAMVAATKAIGGVQMAAIAGAAAIAGVGAVMVGMASKFEKNMTRVAAVSNATADEWRKLENSALSLAATTEFTAIEVADGMNFLAMAGMNATQVIEAMPKALQLASAGMIDISTASNIVTNVMAGMGLEMEDLARANDVLASAITGSNVDVQMLGASFKYVGPAVSAAGISFEETTAALGLLGNAGIQASMAGTTMRGAVSRLLGPVGEASKLLEEYGIQTIDANNKMHSLHDIIEQIEFAGMADGAEGAARMLKVFGLKAGPGMQALVSIGSSELKRFTKRLEESGGTAERLAKMQLSTLWGKTKLMGSAISGLAIDIGQRLIPTMKRLADATAATFRWLNNFSDTTKNAVISITGLTVAFVALKVAVKLLMVLFKSSAWKATVTWMKGMLAPMLAVAVAVMAVIAAIGAISIAWEQNGEAIKKSLHGVKIEFLMAWRDIVAGASKMWQTLMSHAKKFGGWLEETLFRPIRNAMIYVAGKASGDSETTILKTQQKASEHGGLINVTDVEKALDEFNSGFMDTINTLLDTGKYLGKELAVPLADMFVQGGVDITNGFERGLDIISKIDFAGKFRALSEGLGIGKGGAPPGLSKTKATLDPLKAAAAKEAEAKAVLLAQEIQRKKDEAAELKLAHDKWVTGIGGIFSSVISSMGEAGEIFSAAKQGMEAGGPWGAIIAVIATLLSKTEFFADLITHLSGIIQTIVGAIGDSISGFSVLMPVINLASKLAFKLLNAVTGVNFIMQIFAERMGKLSEGITTVLRAITKGWNTMLRKMANWAAKTLPFGDQIASGLRAMIISWEDQVADNEELWGEGSETDDVKKSAAETSEALSSVPDGYKIALAKFEAMDARPADGLSNDAPSGGNEGAGGNTTNNIYLLGSDMDELARQVAELTQGQIHDETGTTQAPGGGNFQDRDPE